MSNCPPLPYCTYYCAPEQSVLRSRGGWVDAKVDDRRHLTSVYLVHQQVAGLEVAMHHALLVRMLHALADADHQFDAPAQRQAVFFAELRQRTAGDELH